MRAQYSGVCIVFPDGNYNVSRMIGIVIRISEKKIGNWGILAPGFSPRHISEIKNGWATDKISFTKHRPGSLIKVLNKRKGSRTTPLFNP
jgi:hypothetical protein